MHLTHHCPLSSIMKKVLVLFGILLINYKCYSQSVGITSPVSSTSYCAGSGGVVVNYTISGTFSNTPSPNVFSVQISDPTGNFGGSPATIGTATSVSNGSISCTLPSTLLTGGLYRFRMVSSNPPVIGPDNGANLTIIAIALNTPTVISNSFCQGETFVLSFSQSTCNFVNTPSANVYSVQLSDAAGSFSSPVVVGTRTGIVPAAITCTLPPGTPTGTGYRLRMTANSPASTGPDNGSNISVLAAAGSPTVFGNGVWNVYCYNGVTFSSLFGFYTENNLNFNSAARWTGTLSPSSANASSGAAYVGCNLANGGANGTIHKRINFTCGYYRIDLTHLDFVLLAINGATVFQNVVAGTDNGVWTGFLGASSTVEIRHYSPSGGSQIVANFVPVTSPIGPPVNICSGTSATLTTNFVPTLTYSWSPSAGLSNTIGNMTTASPTVSTIYTCTVTEPTTSCSFNATTAVIISALPATSVSPTSVTVNCASQSRTLIAGGANTYSWSPAAGLSTTTGYSVVASPTVNTTYTVTGNNNCSMLNATVFVSLVPLVNPTVFPSGTWHAYCYTPTTFSTYLGYYTENGSGASGYDFHTNTRWAGAVPSSANAVNGNAYLGCPTGNTSWSVSFKRTGFACNTYSIQVPYHDDGLNILINGTLVAPLSSNNYTGNVWVGLLTPSATVEFRLIQVNGGAGLNALFVPAMASPSLAVWSGVTSNNWFTSSNWCGSAVPSASTDVLVNNSGTLFQPVINTTGAACNNLTISPAVAANASLSAIGAGSLSLTGTSGLDVYGSWINNGSFIATAGTVNLLSSASRTFMCIGTQTFNTLVLNTTGSTTVPSGTHVIANNMNLTSGVVESTNALFRFSNGATAINASNASYVDGPIVKFGNQPFTFPLGSGGYYRPIGISAPSSTTDNFTAMYNPVDPSPSFTNTSKDATIHHISSCEHWILNRTGGSSSVSVTLSWDANSCGVSVLPDLLVARWDAAQLKWKDQGNGGTAGNTSTGTVISGSLVSSFSPFTLGSQTLFNALPIELLDFSATCAERGVQLNWSTASERNNNHFSLERSEDGILWKKLTRVPAPNNTSSIKKYSYVDSLPSDSLSYYRLIQVDNDGHYTTLKTVYALCYPDENNFAFYPNPTNKNVTLLIKSVYKQENGWVKIVDCYGKPVYSEKLLTAKGINTFPLQLGLEPGIYFISYTSTTVPNRTHKLIVEH